MDSNTVEELNFFCRLCLLRSEEEGQLVDIFRNDDSSESSKSLSCKILECVSIELSNHLVYEPKKICLRCLNHINVWYEFKTSCNAANDVLQKCIQEVQEKQNPTDTVLMTTNDDGLLFPEISLLSCDTLLEKSMSSQSNISSIVNYFLSPEKKKKTEIEPAQVEFGDNFCQRIGTFGVPTSVSDTKPASPPEKPIEKKSNTKDKGYYCVLCDRSFRHFSLFLSHDDSIHFTETRKYSCSVCDRLFILEDRLNIHTRLVHRQKTHQCPICDKLFASAKSLDVHSRLHSEKYKCEKCGYLTTSKLYLNQHLQKHQGLEVDFTCNICQQKFSQKSALLRHNKLHTATNGKCFKCSICMLLFRSHSELKSHKSMHFGQYETHKCRTCGKVVSSLKTLRVHQKRHQELKFSCSVCEKKFLSNYDLRVHMDTHSDSKLFSCFHCDKKFSFKKCLMRHLKKCYPVVRSDLIVQ